MQILRLVHTVKHLKLIQIYYQLWYRFKRRVVKNPAYIPYKGNGAIEWQNYIHWFTQWYGNNTFNFINIEHQFEHNIDWNYNQYGKLWTYNLNYFDWLHQENLNVEDGLELIRNYINNKENLVDGLESYPTSLRLINWVKFMGAHDINDVEINEFIYNDALRLNCNLEYHLLANHLLENAFALTFAGVFLSDSNLLNKGKKLLFEQLEEQILKDGAHYELSPMYHQLMLYRVLDTIQLLKNSSQSSNSSLVDILESKAEIMLGWLKQVTFRNGDIPLVNDSAFKITPSIFQLQEYAEQLGVSAIQIKLKSSGYRKLVTDDMECFINVGNILPTYQPAHAHSDSLQFLIYLDKMPFMVEMGTSTYDIGKRRELERSSVSHNVVTIDGKNSSDVWSAFRIGRRANTTIYEENDRQIVGLHDGYDVDHQRKWMLGEKELTVIDTLESNDCTAHFHFHENYSNYTIEQDQIKWPNVTIAFDGAIQIKNKTYLRAETWNKKVQCVKFEVRFKNRLETNIFW